MERGRKFRLTLIAVGVVLAITIGAGVMKKYLDIDITELAKWAMVTVAGAAGIGQTTIAYEDARRDGNLTPKP